MLRKIAAATVVICGGIIATQGAVAQSYPPAVVGFAASHCTTWEDQGYLNHQDCMTDYEQSYPDLPNQ